MEYDRNLKVEYATRYCYTGSFTAYRYIFYRIVPSQLKWWQRVFCNGWKTMYKATDYSTILGNTTELFTLAEYTNEIFKLKTYGEVCDYLAHQKELANKSYLEHKEKIKNGETWPD